MPARERLNAAAINGTIIVAGLLGALSGSWLLFGLVVAVGIVTSILGGGIRLKRRNR